MRALLRLPDTQIAAGLGEPSSPRVLPEGAGSSMSAKLPPATLDSREETAEDEAASGPIPDIESIYDRHANLVYRLALVLLRSREEAEDLTQDVFASLCGAAAYDPNRGSMRTFLSAMTRSRAIDRMRSRGRSARLLDKWPEAVPFGEAPAMPWEGASIRRTAERVRGALAGLPAAQRQVLEMAYYEGLSQREIATELDAPLGTVKSRSRRALQELGDVLDDFGV